MHTSAPIEPDRSLRRRRPLVIVIMAGLIGLGWAGWTCLRGVRVSIEAEYNLHATILTIRVVEQFVTDKRRWPHSWIELEDQSLPNELQVGMYPWPESSADVRRRVIVDFDADPHAIVAQ